MLDGLWQDLFDDLSSWGKLGMLLALFLLFYIDAIVFPTLPELFTIVIFAANPTLEWGLMILVTIAIAEFLGISTLYIVVRRVRVPQRVQDAADRYRNFLFVSDERVILMNRLAPMLPFLGAFVAMCSWSFYRSVFYNFIGGMLKYGLILMASGFFYEAFTSDLATLFTIVMVLFFIGLSVVASIYQRRRLRLENS